MRPLPRREILSGGSRTVSTFDPTGDQNRSTTNALLASNVSMVATFAGKPILAGASCEERNSSFDRSRPCVDGFSFNRPIRPALRYGWSGIWLPRRRNLYSAIPLW